MKRNRVLVIFFALLFIVASALIIANLPGEQDAPEDKADQVEDITPSDEEEDQNDERFALLQENTKTWGLGRQLTEYVSNDRSYEWYVDQGDTGEYSANNCGPASVAMVGHWLDESFPAATSEIRELIPADGGWWYSWDISNALEQHSIAFTEIPIEDHDTLVEIIDEGAIAILNNEMGVIPFNSDAEQRVQRFYSYSSGHYFVLKGYAIVDGNLFFEVYDPNNWGKVYEDGQPMGKDRYYAAEELLISLEWWPKAVVIYPQ